MAHILFSKSRHKTTQIQHIRTNTCMHHCFSEVIYSQWVAGECISASMLPSLLTKCCLIQSPSNYPSLIRHKALLSLLRDGPKHQFVLRPFAPGPGSFKLPACRTIPNALVGSCSQRAPDPILVDGFFPSSHYYLKES